MTAAYPYTFTVQFDISNGSVWGGGFVLDTSQLGLGTFSDGSTYDITSSVQKIDVGGGYDLIQNQFNTNKGTIRVLDTTGLWNPQNTASPFYGKLIPLRKIRVSINSVDGNGNILQSTVYGTYFTIGYNYSYPQNQAYGWVDIDVMDAFRIFNMSNVSYVPNAVAGQTTGARINAILDAIQWPVSLRNIEAGSQITGADPGTNRTALNAIKNAEWVEQGAFFIDENGFATFYSGTTLAKRNLMYDTFQQNLTWVQNVSGLSNNLQYQSVKMAYDDKLIVNQTTAQMNGGQPQSVSDQTSINAYFPHTVTQTSLVGSSDFQMLNLAGVYTATRKDTTIRFDVMNIDFTQDFWWNFYPNNLPPVFAYVPLQPIRIINSQYSGASTVSKTLQIVGSNIHMTPTQFSLTLTTSESLVDGFILASPPHTGTEFWGYLDKSVLGY